jgi:hypothetical protein
MKAYIVGNGKSILGWPGARPMYATNKFPEWFVPDVYVLTSIHAMRNWLGDCLERAKRVSRAGGRVIVWDLYAEQFRHWATPDDPKMIPAESIRVDPLSFWYKDGIYGNAGGSLFPLMQRAILDGAKELVLIGVDGFRGRSCGDNNHYDPHYFDTCSRNPGTQTTNAILMAGHEEAARQCRELDVKVSIIGKSMFASFYKEE